MQYKLMFLAMLLAVGGVKAAPVCAAPLAVAEAFHAASVDDVLDATPALLTERLGAAFAGERECQVREQGICRLDYDPWLDGQDGEIDGAVHFAVAQPAAQGRVEVRADYRVWGEARHARLLLREERGCWRMDDFIDNGGGSLHDLLTGP